MTEPGIAAAFASAENAVAAARAARAAGYVHIDLLSPFSTETVPGVDEALGGKPSHVRVVMLVFAVAGGLTMLGLQTWSAVFDYPINSGGRALFSWPAFMLATFEVAVLGAAVGGFVAVLVGGGMPSLHHRQFDIPDTERASQDRFILILPGTGGQFDSRQAGALLEAYDPIYVRELTQ